MRGRFHQMALVLMCLLLACSLGAGAKQAFPTLPLDTFQGGPAPRDEHYLSDTLYEDDTIRVEIFPATRLIPTIPMPMSGFPISPSCAQRLPAL